MMALDFEALNKAFEAWVVTHVPGGPVGRCRC